MLSTTIVHGCQRCGSAAIRKNGPAENRHQRAKGLACGRTFVLQPKGARYDERFKAQVVAAYQDRMSIRGITRAFGVCYETLLQLGGGKKRKVSRRSWTRACPLKTGTCWSWMSFGASWAPKPASFGSGWRFVAAPARPVAWTPGDRSLQSACDLWASLPKGHRGRAARSDFWNACAGAFPPRTHRRCGKEEGATCHVERWFGTLRARLSPLVRRAYSFSKHAENHLAAVHLFIVTYNLAILHKATVR